MYKITTDQIEHFNYKKNSPDLVDRFGNSISGEYFQGYQALYQYIYDVVSGEIKTCVYSRNACLRIANDIINRDDLILDHTEIDFIIIFANSLNHVKGGLSGKPIMLMKWMIFTIGSVMGFYYVKGKRKGERRFQKAFVMVARGNAKSFICSILVLYGIMINENGKPYSCSAARTQKQAKIVLEDSMDMIKGASVEIKSMFKLKANHIECITTKGRMEAISSDAQSTDGKRLSGVGVCDELHAHTDSSVYNVLKTAMGSSIDPLLFSISTAGSDVEGICGQIMYHMREVNADLSDDDRYFGLEYSIDEDDEYDDPSVWIKANPSLGHSVNEEYLVSTLAEAQMNVTQRNDFITKHCNRFVTQSENAYIDLMNFQECSADIDIDDYWGRECYLGLDLAQRTDLCSLAYTFTNEDGSLDIFTRNYLPKGVLKRVKKSVKEKYLNWEKKGTLVLTEGESTDWTVIMDDIRDAWSKFNVKCVAYDPANSTQLALKLEEENILMIDVRQGFGLSEPAKLLEALVLDKKIRYNKDDNVLEWCISNAVKTEGRFQDIIVHKQKEKQDAKVDSVIAVLTAMKLIVIDIDESSTYEDKDIIQL